MRRVVGVEPIFVVSDVPRAVAHYERLGFSTSHHDEGYAFAHRNELTIHLAGPGVDPERVGQGSIYMHVDDADAFAAEWRAAGVDLVGPEDFEWASVRARTKIPTGTSFASDRRFSARAVWTSWPPEAIAGACRANRLFRAVLGRDMTLPRSGAAGRVQLL